VLSGVIHGPPACHKFCLHIPRTIQAEKAPSLFSFVGYPTRIWSSGAVSQERPALPWTLACTVIDLPACVFRLNPAYICNINILDHLHDSVASFASFTRPHAQSATCLFGTHYNRRELTEPMTDENYSPYPKIGLDGLVMAHGHWINRCIDPSCMFCEFGIFCLSDTPNFGILVPIWTCE
jgi:hypothetical protein